MATEPNRIWHEPEVIIYGNLITPGTRCSAEAYDLANRRWYKLNVEAEVWDEDWLSGIITDYIKKYYHAYASLPPFNVICTTREGTPTTSDLKPEDIGARPQSSNNDVMGILMPFGGASLASILDSESSRPTDAFTNITGRQLGDLVRGVQELAQVGVQHGDINDRNTLPEPYQNTHRLVMVDLGEVAPGYTSDAYASERSSSGAESARHGIRHSRGRSRLAQILQESGDFDKALDVLAKGLSDDLAANADKSKI